MKAVVLVFLFAFSVIEGYAVVAYPYPVALQIDGKTRYIRLYGDEYCKWAETEDGYTIVRDSCGRWCYAQAAGDTSLVASPWLIGSEEQSLVASFLRATPKHLMPSAATKQRSHAMSAAREARALTASRRVVGERRVLVILMSYQDRPFTKSQEDYHRLFNEEGYADDHARGSVRDFYLAASYKQLSLQSDIYGPYAAEHDMAYYGKNGRNDSDTNPYALFVEAISHVAAETDLHAYDGDGDGFIDNVHIIFAGYGEEAGAPADAIWSHEATFYRPYEVQGLKIDHYSCAPELRGNSGNGISRIGPHCHEIGHALGAKDFYDTDYATGGQFLGTGKWDVMAQGSWNDDGVTPADFNPYVKAYNYGWVTPQVLPPGVVTLRPSCDDVSAYYLLKASEYGDYYLLENRSRQGWGTDLPGEGLLLFHVHADIGNADNDINTTAPQMCYVVCASSTSKRPGRNAASYGDINSSGCPFPGSMGKTRFGPDSTPQPFYWDGSECDIDLSDISLNADGDIILQNNSKASDYKPQQWISIFFEGFEDELHINGLDNSMWAIEENPENTATIVSHPIAYNGVRSLQLTSGNASTDISDTLTFSCMPTSGSLRLKVSATAMRPRLAQPNTVTVGYRTFANAEWHYGEPLATANNRWRQFIVELPQDVSGEFILSGSAYGGSVLAIDDIEIEQANGQGDEAAITAPHAAVSSTPPVVYSLTGQRLQHAGRGLHLIYNGTTTKKLYKKK